MNRWRWYLSAAIVGVIVGVASTSALARSGLPGQANDSLIDRCSAGDMPLAATTRDGAQVHVGQIGLADVGWDGPSVCVSYRDRNGVTGIAAGPIGAAQKDLGVVLKALDTATGEYVVVAAVPDGYTSVSVLGSAVPVTNNVLVIDARDARDGMTIQGPAGVEKIDLALGN